MGVFRKWKIGALLGVVFCCLISSSIFFKRLRQFACCGLLLCATLAGAAEFTITGEARDIYDNGQIVLVSTTANTGACQVRANPNYCSRSNAASILGSFDTLISAVSADGFIKSEVDANPRMGPYIDRPKGSHSAGYSVVTLTNETTGSTFRIRITVPAIAGHYILSQPGPGGNHRGLWHNEGESQGSDWSTASPSCSSPGFIDWLPDTSTESEFWWQSYSGSSCYKKILDDIPGPFRYRNFQFFYMLSSVDLLSNVDAGVYKGSLTYSVGPGGDFDFGDKMIASDNVITVNFEFTVNPSLKVDFPPGSNRAILQPLRGWQAWLNSGRTPPALSASHGFKISGSGPFKVYLRCDIQMGLSCGIQGQGVAAKGILVAPVDIAVTFPPSIVQTPGNRPAIKVPLKSGVANAATFDISGLQKSQSATIHYDVAAEQTALMVESPGSTYQGIVTLIFDAAL